jgi:hypothetical protein
MADSTTGQVIRAFTSREAAAVGVVATMLVLSHLVAPAVAPGYAVYARYATYLVAFSVWMAWFVDRLAVWLGKDPHPSERERDGA